MIGAYGAIALTYIATKLFSSLRYSPYSGDVNSAVSVIIPEYNEDPELFERGLQSLLEQDRELEEIWVVDDGSDDTRAWEIAQRYAADYACINAHRLPENRGKRHAQAYAFERATGDIFITMDSDTVLHDDSLTELLRPFADDDVTAVTGRPEIVNRDENILTKLIDMRYWVAFNVERAAQSVNGTVVCCCGVLSAYRADIIREELDAYTGQTFWGSECSFGDDRHLTAKCLQRGKVLYQSTAVSKTAAPTGIREYITQQARWMRSFWRESYLALKWAPRRSKLLTGMLIADMTLPFALVLFGFGAMVITALSAHSLLILTAYTLIVAGIAYVRNAPYAKENISLYALSPVYAVLYLTCLLPLSFYALATVTESGWGTR